LEDAVARRPARLQSGQGRMAKSYQVKQLLAAIERLGTSAEE
jgi:hypothetical protein